MIAPNKKYLFSSITIALILCFAHVVGNRMLILACLASYMALVALCCSYDFTLPILLFFLPWSPILRLEPSSYSFYTFGLVLICLISVIKKRFFLKRYQITAGILLIFVTLLSRLMEGNSLTFYYFAFMMMIVFFPSVCEEERKQKYDFYQVAVFFSMGVVLSSMSALFCAQYANIQRFIRVDTYLTILRRSGFYGDANFYAAQILAALGGTLSLSLGENKKNQIILLGIMSILLVYCGLLSGSKSFVLVAAVILIMWIIAILRMSGRTGLKISLLLFFGVTGVFIATSVLFSSLLEVVMTRFSFSTDLDSFTTGRTELWKSYIGVLFENPKTFFLGKGITDIKVNAKASHSTIIQIFYQLGLVGAPVMIYWIISFYRQSTRKRKHAIGLTDLIVIIGAFMPWLAIDALLFDEFFLFQWFVLSSLVCWREKRESY